jgi:hypothetical protein
MIAVSERKPGQEGAEKSASRNKKRTSAAKAALKLCSYGTAEAMPLSKTAFSAASEALRSLPKAKPMAFPQLFTCPMR